MSDDALVIVQVTAEVYIGLRDSPTYLTIYHTHIYAGSSLIDRQTFQVLDTVLDLVPECV